MKHISIDRFEGDFAICVDDDGKIFNLKIYRLPKNAKQGDVLKILGNEIKLDFKETKKRKEEIFKLQEDLFN